MYERTWRNKFLTEDAKTIEEMIAGLQHGVRELQDMQRDGVRLAGGANDDYAHLVTDDPAVADRYGFRPTGMLHEE